MNSDSNDALVVYKKIVSDVIAARLLKAQIAIAQRFPAYSGVEYGQFYADLAKKLAEARGADSPTHLIQTALEVFQRDVERAYEFNTRLCKLELSITELDESVRCFTLAPDSSVSSGVFERFLGGVFATDQVKRERDKFVPLIAEISNASKRAKSLAQLEDTFKQYRGLLDQFAASRRELQTDLRKKLGEVSRADAKRQDLLEQITQFELDGQAYVNSWMAEHVRKLPSAKPAHAAIKRLFNVEIVQNLTNLPALRAELGGTESQIALELIALKLSDVRKRFSAAQDEVVNLAQKAKQSEAIELEWELLHQAGLVERAKKLKLRKIDVEKLIADAGDTLLARWVPSSGSGVSQQLVDEYCDHTSIKPQLDAMRTTFMERLSHWRSECQNAVDVGQLDTTAEGIALFVKDGQIRRGVFAANFAKKASDAKQRIENQQKSKRSNVVVPMMSLYAGAAVFGLWRDFSFFNLFVWVLGVALFGTITSVVATAVTTANEPRHVTLSDLLGHASGTKID